MSAAGAVRLNVVPPRRGESFFQSILNPRVPQIGHFEEIKWQISKTKSMQLPKLHLRPHLHLQLQLPRLALRLALRLRPPMPASRQVLLPAHRMDAVPVGP